jgi:RNA polymerase sigma-54 factor
MKPALQLKLSQHLALTPQLQQSIKLLQLSTVEMQQEIENYLLENPMLERDDDGASESFAAAQQFDAPRSDAVERADHDERDERDARDDREQAIPATPTDVDDDRWSTDAGTFTGAGRDDEDDNDSQDIHGGTPSLREHLTWQLGMTQLSDRDRSLVRFLIEALDDDGYLSSPLKPCRRNTRSSSRNWKSRSATSRASIRPVLVPAVLKNVWPCSSSRCRIARRIAWRC